MTKKQSKRKEERRRRKGAEWFKHFFMKWKFRIDQARSIFSLLTFAALLAVAYIKYITFLDNMGIWGVLLLSLIVAVGFLIGGYIYDRGLKLWKDQGKVVVERNPYSYSPGPKEHIWTKGQWAYQTLVLLDKNTFEHDKLYAELLEIYYAQEPAGDFESQLTNLRNVCDKLNNDLIELLKTMKSPSEEKGKT